MNRAGLRGMLRVARNRAASGAMPIRIIGGRLRRFSPFLESFAGAWPDYASAMASIPHDRLAGYDHASVADACFEEMCEVLPWDYPLLFWLEKLGAEVRSVVDAGGHMGTKYRAFRRLLDIDARYDWTVYDVPAIVQAGRAQAVTDGLTRLAFGDRPENLPEADMMLASGLLQYLEQPFAELLLRLPVLPPHLLLNKVALRDGPTVVTLEVIGNALVPYQILSRTKFLAPLAGLGYSVIDEWAIPALSHRIVTHPELGSSRSAGFYLRRDGARCRRQDSQAWTRTNGFRQSEEIGISSGL